jgi:RNA polymerase sigma-70 factor (ECF subfamily)
VSLRRWIAAVMRNLARQSRRGEVRRADRELAAARSAGHGHGEPPADSLVRLEAHRAVVEAVMGLHEPYRKTVVLRYFDGLEPRVIAARERVPVRTVHTRLTRAHALLRARLEHRLGRGAGRCMASIPGPPARPRAERGMRSRTRWEPCSWMPS